MKHDFHITGHLEGVLDASKPIPAVFRLNRHKIDPLALVDLGKLLESVRLNVPKNIIRAQLIALADLGVSPEIIEIFLKARIKFDMAIRNGAGNVGMTEAIIRVLEELKHKGDEVSTYGLDKVISAGAYIWKTGAKRYTLDDSQYMWHTLGLDRGLPMGKMLEDKTRDYHDIRSFLETAREPLRSRFIDALNEDDDGKHEIRTSGRTLAHAGLADRSFGSTEEMKSFLNA